MEKVISTLNHLIDQVSRGLAAFAVAKAINEAFETNRITHSYYFFTTTYLATLESTLLTLSRIVIHNKDSININFLFELILQHSRAFPHANKTTILRMVKQHRSEMLKADLLINELKIQRDKLMAHLDRVVVNDHIRLESLLGVIDMDNVEKVYHLLSAILSTYKVYAEKTAINMTAIEENISSDLNYMLGLIEKVNKED